MYKPTLQIESLEVAWTRRTGMAVIRAAITPAGVELEYAHCRDCLTPLRADGSCGLCGALGDPLVQQLCDAVEADDSRAASLAEARLSLAARDTAAPLNGCAQCDRLERDHSMVRSHGWDAPTDRIRLARLCARRRRRPLLH
jgi:hypothetical protein